MSWHTWLWAIALAIFMYGGPYALPFGFALASAAVMMEHTALFQRLKWLAGILVFMLASWLIWQCGSLFGRIPLHAEPLYLRDFLSHFGPNDFMGIPLHGRWWIGIYYFVVLLVANVASEEFWWRGYLLPRQELSHGAAAWLVHGSLWGLFHLFFQWTLQDLTHMLPTCCALAFVAQHRKLTTCAIRVSEREKFYIESHYYQFVLDDLEKARQVYELWAQTYPREPVPPNNLTYIYGALGQYEKALLEAREAFRLNQASGYGNLANAFLQLNRIEETRATVEEAQAKNFDSPPLHFIQYQLGFLQNDAAEMKRQVAWAVDKPGWDDVLLASEANTAAYSGQLGKAREFSRRAVASAERAEEKETAAGYEAEASLREALFGNAAQARQRATAALTLSAGRDVQYGAALALALAGDVGRAQAMSNELSNRFSADTIVHFNYLPTIHALVALSRNDSSKALEALQPTAPYDFFPA